MADKLLLPLAEAAAACYIPGNQPTWQSSLRLVHVFHSLVKIEEAWTNCFAFEGTTDIQEWMVDFFAVQIPVIEHPQLGFVHAGFLLDVQAVIGNIYNKMASLGWPPFYICGHSKGAGEAILCAGLMKAMGHPALATRAYEPPRVGGEILKEYLADQDLAWTQTYNSDGLDLVTLVPEGPSWCHDGTCVRLEVPDSYGIAEKHRIPAVIESIKNLDKASPAP